MLLLATLTRTLGTGTLWVFSAALLQTIVPDRFRGRVFSFEFASLTLTQSISTITAGYLLDVKGLPIQGVMAVMASIGVVVTAVWASFHLANRRNLREEPTPIRVVNK